MAVLNKLEFDFNQDITISLEKGYCYMACDGKFDREDKPIWGTARYRLKYEDLKSLHNVIETAMFMMEGRK